MTGFEPEEIDLIIDNLETNGEEKAVEVIRWLEWVLNDRDDFLVQRDLFSEYAAWTGNRPE